MKEKKNFLSDVLPNLWIILIVLFIYLPIVYVVVFSFNDSKSLTNFTGFSFRWYEKMFADKTMMEAIYYTVLVSLIATIVSTVIGTITSIGLSKQKKIVREIVLQINELPVMNPDIVTAIGLMLLFISLNVETSFWTLLLAHITFCIPYVILSIMPKLRTLDDNVAEAALDLGATPWQALTKVIIPQIAPAIVSGALIAFSMSFDDFVISFFTTGTGVTNISIFVYSMSKRINPSINALSAIIVLVVTTILVLVNILPSKKTVDISNKKKKWWIPAVCGALTVALIVGLFARRTTQEFDPIAEFGSDTLNVFNTGEYIGEGVIEGFEERYNVTVNYDIFASNEEMYTKLMTGTSYDVVIPSDYMIERLIAEDMLQPYDKEIVTNTEFLCEGVQVLDFDPEGLYAVPYFWGTVGIVYDTTLVDSEDVESEGWEVLRNEKYKGMLYMYDNERDSFMIALKALGYSTNTDNVDEINEAYQWLIGLDNATDPAYVTDEVIDGMIYGEKAMGVMYSGDACYAMSENENLAYWEPQQGTNAWIDCMIIPKNAKSPTLANVFIQYMLEHDTAYANSDFVGYTSSLTDVQEELYGLGGTYEGIDAYVPRSGYELDETYRNVEILRKTISELWVKVKMN